MPVLEDAEAKLPFGEELEVAVEVATVSSAPSALPADSRRKLTSELGRAKDFAEEVNTDQVVGATASLSGVRQEAPRSCSDRLAKVSAVVPSTAAPTQNGHSATAQQLHPVRLAAVQADVAE